MSAKLYKNLSKYIKYLAQNNEAVNFQDNSIIKYCDLKSGRYLIDMT